MELRLPNINGDTPQMQVQQMKSYLYHLVEQLNFTLGSLDVVERSIVEAVVKNTGASKGEAHNTFLALKDLIVKTADIVKVYEEEYIKSFSGKYTAESDFGTYVQNTISTLTANSKEVKVLFENVGKITNTEGTGLLDKIQAYVKVGLLDDSATPPIYGLEIGQTENSAYTKFARFTSDKISFYNGNNNEVAYVSNNKIFINEAQFNNTVSIGNVSGGELNIYNGKINVYDNNENKVFGVNGMSLELNGTISQPGSGNKAYIGTMPISHREGLHLINYDNPAYELEDTWLPYLTIDNDSTLATTKITAVDCMALELIDSTDGSALETSLILGTSSASDYGWITGTWYGNWIAVSDRNKKNSIKTLPIKYSVFFDKLRPVIYKFNDGTSNRYHTGFISQEVEQALKESGIDTSEFAGFVKRGDEYFLRYDEFIALNTAEIQRLKKENTNLKAKVSELEKRLSQIETELSKGDI